MILIINKLFFIYFMDSILRIPPLLSKAIDTLCLQISLNRSDQNSLGLIEILGWRIEAQISSQEFSQLYKNWLESKKITSILNVRQQDIYSKVNLLNRMPESFLNYTQIIKCLQILNQQYNDEYLRQIKAPRTLNLLESVFSYLDFEGVIHLRFSQLLFLYMAITPKQSYNNESIFKMDFGSFRKSLGEIQGKVSLRSFKNYLSTIPEAVLTDLTKNLTKMQNKLNLSDHLPDIFSEALNQWYATSSFKYQFREGKQKLELYRRILEEYDYLFFNLNDPQRIYSELELAYGYQQINFYDIGLNMVKEFHKHINTNVSKYIVWYFGNSKPVKIPSKLSFRDRSRQSKESVRMSPVKHSSSVQKMKIGSARLERSVQKLSRSIDQLHLKGSVKRLPVPYVTKRVGTRTPAEYRILEDMNLFKGRRIESFESVMRRLKKRK